MTDDPAPRLHGDVALNMPRHRGPREPLAGMDPGPADLAARVAQPAG